jgi:hypothetical protein
MCLCQKPVRQQTPFGVLPVAAFSRMVKRWGKDDDSKLKSIWELPRNGIRSTDLSVATVKAVHQKFFPERSYRPFAALYRSKAREYESGKAFDGARKKRMFFFIAKYAISANLNLTF